MKILKERQRFAPAKSKHAVLIVMQISELKYTASLAGHGLLKVLISPWRER